MNTLIVGLLWAVVGFRLLRWRASSAETKGLTAGIGLWAVTATLNVAGGQLDAAVGVANLSSQLKRLTIGATWIALQPWLFRYLPAGARGRRRLKTLSGVLTLAMVVSTTVLWVAAPIHDQQLPSLNSVDDPTMTAYVVVGYAWLTWILCELIFASTWAFLSLKDDPPGRVFTILLALVGVNGLVAVALMSGDHVWHPASPTALSTNGAALMAPATGLIAAAVASVPCIEWLMARRTAEQEIRQLKGRWLHVVQQCPSVVMPLPWPIRLLDRPLVAVRMRIEVLDGEAELAAAADDSGCVR